MKQFVLPNGLTCIFIFKPIHTVTINIITKVGSRDESPELYGGAHLLEHLLFKETKKRKNYKDIYTELEILGNYNASTSKNTTNYFITTPKNKCQKCLELLSDLLFNSTLNNINKEKKVVLEELNFTKNDDSRYSLSLLFKLYFENHPLEHLIIGTEKSIHSINKKQLYKFYKKYYTPSNMCLLLCGDYPKNSKQLVTKYFSVKNNNHFKNPIPKLIVPIQTKPKFKIIQKQTPQAYISLGFPIDSIYNQKQKCILLLLSNLFGNSLNSRLNILLREKKGLIYSIYCGLEQYQDNGIFYIQCSTDSKKLLTKKGVLFLLITELLKKKKITKKELQQSKQIVTTKIIVTQDEPLILTEHYGNQIIFKQKPIKSIDSFKKIIEAVTLSEINSLLQSIFNSSTMNICIISNFQEKKIMTQLSTIL